MTRTDVFGRREAADWLFAAAAWLLLVAFVIAGVATYSESASFCPSFLGRSLVDPRTLRDCQPYLDDRTIRVIALVFVAGLAAAVGFWVRRRPSTDPMTDYGHDPISGPVQALRAAISLLAVGPVLVIAGLLTVLATEDIDYLGSEAVFALLPLALSAGVLLTAVVAAAAGPRRQRLASPWGSFAAAVAYPWAAFVIADLDTTGGTDYGLADPGWQAAHLPYLGVPLALALVLICRARNRGVGLVPLRVSLVALLASAALVYLAIAPDAIPPGLDATNNQPLGRYLCFMLLAVVVPYSWLSFWVLRHREWLRSDVDNDGARSVVGE